MTMLEQFGRYIPDYYPTMYLDSYTPYEIMGIRYNKLRKLNRAKK